jgi:hypothetical protein
MQNIKKRCLGTIVSAIVASAPMLVQAAVPAFTFEGNGEGRNIGILNFSVAAATPSIFQSEVFSQYVGKGNRNPTTGFNITEFDLLVFNPNKDKYAVLVNGVAHNSATTAGNNDRWTITAAPLMAGSYQLKIVGKGDIGAIYGGSYPAGAVTPVPEPETYAMLLAGLGVVSISLRRKKYT